MLFGGMKYKVCAIAMRGRGFGMRAMGSNASLPPTSVTFTSKSHVLIYNTDASICPQMAILKIKWNNICKAWYTRKHSVDVSFS